MTSPAIATISGRRVWDSRGRPTLEVEVTTGTGARGRAIAPAGASRGSAEATDLRDGGPRLGGYDVQGALRNVEQVIAPALIGQPVGDQAGADRILDALDPSPTRQVLGGNATVAVSLAVLHAAAAAANRPLWAHLDPEVRRIPRPQIQIIGGGAHAGRRVDIQDFMVVPLSATRIDEALVHVAEVYRSTGELLAERGPALGVADEGGHWPAVDGTEAAIELLTEGIGRTGLRPGVDMAISLDIAASEFESGGRYHLASDHADYSRDEWIERLDHWLRTYPIVAVEDPVSERDAAGMREATRRLGGRVLVVGDDFLVTSADRIATAGRDAACTAALIKVNQVGTVTRAAAAQDAARRQGWATIVSARSGESEDVAVAHLATGWGADLIKVGSIARGERTAKWNELIRIDDELGGVPLAPYPDPSAIPIGQNTRTAIR